MRWVVTGLVLVAVAVAAVIAFAGGDDAASPTTAAAAPAPPLRGCGPDESVNPPAGYRNGGVDAGPVSIVGFAELFTDAPVESVTRPGPHGEFILKAALIIRGDREVTLEVPRSQRRLLAIAAASADDEIREGSPVVRYEACPRGRRLTGYAGALIYAGPWGRCVPLNIRIEGRRRPIVVQLPLGRRCD